MAARPILNSASRRSLPPEAQESAVAAGPHPEALLVVIAAALLLMTGPALVGVLSILDANLTRGAAGWVNEAPSWLQYLTHARIVLAFSMAPMIARAKEDS